MTDTVTAKLSDAPISAQKARLVVNEVRGLPVGRALDFLTFCPKKAARIIKKLLNSALANAENNRGMDVDELVVSSAYVDEGLRLKRMHPRAKGRGNRILKRRCHITVKVSARDEGSA